MWGWPQSSSSSNATPSFQASNEYSSSAYPVAHNAQTRPMLSSQTSSVGHFQLLSSYPEYNHSQQQQAGSLYSLSSTSSTPQIHTPWNMDISGSSSHMATHKPAQLSPNPTPSIHMMAPPSASPVVVAAPTPPSTAPLSQGGQVGEPSLGSDPHDPGSSFHKVSSGLSSSSPFSMDFILQKSVPADNTPGVGYVQQPTNNQFVEQPTRYSEVPYQVAPPTAMPPLSGSYESSLGAPPQEMGILHGSPSFDTNSQHVNQVGIGPHVSGSFSNKQQFCPSDKLEPFQVCPSEFNPPQSTVLPSGGGAVDSLPPSEVPYSPPELVLGKDDLEEEKEKEDGKEISVETPSNTVVSATYGEAPCLSERDLNIQTLNMPQSSSHVRPSSFGINEEDDDDDDDDDDEGSPTTTGGGNFLSGGFQLGVSPSPPPAPRPPSQPAEDQTSESSSPPPSANEEDRKGESSSSGSSTSSSSDSSTNSEDNSMDTAATEQTEDLEQPYETSYQDEMKTGCNTAAIPLPPPLVPTHTLSKNDGNEYEGDNDDVFLPSSPNNQTPLPIMKSPSSKATQEGPSSTLSGSRKNGKSSSEKPLSLNEGERKTGSLVVGKRGRAAGKILDEEKLRVPLVNGWQRIVRTRLGENNGPTRVDICYVTPCKRRLRTFPEIQRYMDHNGITDLTIANFSFSKKVNVGVIINEETIMDGANEELARPRRGRPPKHLKTIKGSGKGKEDVRNVEDTSKDARISLEPHEIGLNKLQQVSPMVAQKPHALAGSDSSHGNTHSGMSAMQDRSNSAKFAESHFDQLPMVVGNAPPPLVRTGNSNAVEPTTNGLYVVEKKRGWKRKTAVEGGNVPVVKKPRGRPKGSVNKTSGPRKPRIPRNIKYIPPPQLPLPSTISSVNPSPQTQPIVNGDTSGMYRKEDGSANNSNSVKKHLEDKEKRRRLLLKAKENRMRRKSLNNPLQRSHRKIAQQARRERERLAKQKQNAMLKQQEVELEEIRKSRIARQREREYRMQALERTQNLMEQLKKQEEERERIMYLRQLELEKAEQLRRPTEDLLVKNLTTLPTLSKIELVSLSSEAFLDLVTVFQFIQSFDDFLEIDRLPGFIELYCGLFNVKWEEESELKNSEEEGVASFDALLEVLIQMVKAAIHDPGTKTQTVSGCTLREIEVKEHTVSELVRIFLSKVEDGKIQKICCQLEELPFSSLCPSDKTRVLALLVEELLSSTSLCREIDNRMEQICSLRRIKWKISLKLKRFRSHFNTTFGAETPVKPVLYSGRGRPPKKATVSLQVPNIANDGDSSDEEADGGGGVGEDAANSDNEESDYSDEDSDEEPPEEREDLQKRIKEMKKKILSIRGRINASSKQMRIFPLGQDRYTRQYWNLPEMGGVMVEGIETSTFDPLEKYIAEVTYRREVEMMEERRRTCNDSETKAEVDNMESNGLSADLESRATSEIPISLHSSPRMNQSNMSSDPPSIQQSDCENDSQVVGGVTMDTPTSEFTPNSSPPPPADSLESSPEKPIKFSLSRVHPLEIQQFANNRDENNSISEPSTTRAGGKTTTATPETGLQTEINKREEKFISVAGPSSDQPQSSIKHADGSGICNALSSWFSLLPRKQCEVLHYLQMDASQQQQQQGVMVMPQFLGGGGYAYMTPEGTILGQPVVQQVQMGYALVGNTLVQVPQTQYMVGHNPVGVGGTSGQLISLGNGQYALAPGAGNVQYVSINGNQYAIVQAGATDVQETTTEATGVKKSSLTPEPQSHSSASADSTAVAAAINTSLSQEEEQATDNTTTAMQTGSSSTSVSQNAGKNSTPTPQPEEPQQLLTLAIPGTNGEETQLVQVPADPRVLSGECSYAVVPQADGSTQIVLVEKSTLNNAQVLPQGDEVVKVDCPHAVVMGNEYECAPWTIEITLMYADAPLPFVKDGTEAVEKKEVKEKEKKLSQLLDQVNKELTHGWWSITSSLEMDYLIRCLTMRGYREKNLYKLLNKNKDTICNTMNEGKIKLSDSLAHRLKTLVKKEDQNGTSELQTTDQGEESEQGKESQLERRPTAETGTQDKEGNTCMMEVDVDSTEVPSQGQERSDSLEIFGKENNLQSSGRMLVAPSDDAVVWDPYFPDKVKVCTMSILDYLHGMETRLFDAHLPIEGSQKVPEDEMDYEVSVANLLSNISDGLLRLEACVQRRYLKPPFKEKRSEGRKESPEGSTSPAEEPAALLRWRNAVSTATSSSQLGVCMNQLERCIAWEKSPMKVFCVVCRTGDNESLLLLCDKCDRGTHTYCCKPKLDNIPEGNWYCHDCVINASRKTVCNVCETARGILLHCTECPTVIHKRCHNPPLTRVPNGPWQCSTCRRQSRRTKPNQQMKDELTFCYDILKELEEHDDSWPFLEPVDKKKVPGYYKVIKKAMDFSTVKSKLLDGKYSNKESFAADIRLVFDNCSFYNEDDSEIGISGHRMRQYFEKKWAEIEW